MLKNEIGIVPVKEIKEHRTFVFYGRPGTGKTTLASTFPKPLLLLDVRDRGTDSIADIEGVFVKKIRKVADVEAVYWHLYDNPGHYKTVVFDTITNLQQVRVDAALAKKKKGKVKVVGFGTFTRREWGEISADLKVWIQDFRDLPCEVVFICQERTTLPDDEDEDSAMVVPEVGPRAMPSVASLMNSLVSVIGNTYIRERRVKRKDGSTRRVMEYALRVGPNPLYVTKIRNPRDVPQPERLINPVYENIIDTINGVDTDGA